MNVPDPLPVIDGLLAATARVLGLALVTRNIADVLSAASFLWSKQSPGCVRSIGQRRRTELRLLIGCRR